MDTETQQTETTPTPAPPAEVTEKVELTPQQAEQLKADFARLAEDLEARGVHAPILDASAFEDIKAREAELAKAKPEPHQLYHRPA